MVLAAERASTDLFFHPEVEIVWAGTAETTELFTSVQQAGASQKVYAEQQAEKKRLRHQLLYQKYVDRQWASTPEIIYESPHSLTTPSMATKRNGEKLLVWAEQVAGKAQLKLMRGQVSALNNYSIVWQDATLFTDLGRYNIAPSVLIDAQDRAWVFWAADVDDYSDIYYCKETEQGWTEPQRVHAKNNVPDITPYARLSLQSKVTVEWLTYDLTSLRYQLASKSFLSENSRLPKVSAALEKAEQARIDEFRTPEFLPENQRVLVHFPRNRLLQSRNPPLPTEIQ